MQTPTSATSSPLARILQLGGDQRQHLLQQLALRVRVSVLFTSVRRTGRNGCRRRLLLRSSLFDGAGVASRCRSSSGGSLKTNSSPRRRPRSSWPRGLSGWARTARHCKEPVAVSSLSSLPTRPIRSRYTHTVRRSRRCGGRSDGCSWKTTRLMIKPSPSKVRSSSFGRGRWLWPPRAAGARERAAMPMRWGACKAADG